MWSEPTPAVTQSLRCLAFSMSSRVRYPGWKGVVMRISVYAQEERVGGLVNVAPDVEYELTYITNVLLEDAVGTLLVVGDLHPKNDMTV